MPQATAIDSTGPTMPADEQVEKLERELAALEGAVEFLADQLQTVRYAIGGTMQEIFGRQPPKETWGRSVMDRLYPVVDGVLENGYELRRARPLTWRRPKRRFTRYGSKADLKALASSHGIKVRNRTTVETIVRDLWDAGVLEP